MQQQQQQRATLDAIPGPVGHGPGPVGTTLQTPVMAMIVVAVLAIAVVVIVVVADTLLLALVVPVRAWPSSNCDGFRQCRRSAAALLECHSPPCRSYHSVVDRVPGRFDSAERPRGVVAPLNTIRPNGCDWRPTVWDGTYHCPPGRATGFESPRPAASLEGPFRVGVMTMIGTPVPSAGGTRPFPDDPRRVLVDAGGGPVPTTLGPDRCDRAGIAKCRVRSKGEPRYHRWYCYSSCGDCCWCWYYWYYRDDPTSARATWRRGAKTSGAAIDDE
mmetsp:Transcript_21591/g.59922  ORF Transcript_21591/g.59922 Transcript_21591/m.59922 type:complete len:273 (-) Transcript_21591:621-1439(-)